MKKFLMYLFGIPVALYAMLMSYLFIDAYFAYSAKKFDSKAWKIAGTPWTGDRDAWVALGKPRESDRRGMYYDLRDNYLKKGMSYEEVERLLGEWNIVRYCTNLPIKCIKHSMGGGGSSGYGNLVICYHRAKGVIAVGLESNGPDFTNDVCTQGWAAYAGEQDDEPGCADASFEKIPCPKSIERW